LRRRLRCFTSNRVCFKPTKVRSRVCARARPSSPLNSIFPSCRLRHQLTGFLCSRKTQRLRHLRPLHRLLRARASTRARQRSNRWIRKISCLYFRWLLPADFGFEKFLVVERLRIILVIFLTTEEQFLEIRILFFFLSFSLSLSFAVQIYPQAMQRDVSAVNLDRMSSFRIFHPPEQSPVSEIPHEENKRDLSINKAQFLGETVSLDASYCGV